jgi:pyruvate formate lyase activating enzyme
MAGNSLHEAGRKGLVFNIQKFSLHDGAGIRTLIFLKGCPLACRWCSNPEGRSFSPELAYNIEKCIGTAECDRCIAACGRNAVTRGENGRIWIDRKRCDHCGECAEVCPSKALEMVGRWMSAEEVVKTVEEDGAFYVRSGGGLTLSGGEPLAQPGFACDILAMAKRRGLDTAVETSGICTWEAIEAAGPCVDHMFFDIKCRDPVKHKQATGLSNEVILENYQKLRAHFPLMTITVRTPVIPGFNDSMEEIESIRQFLKHSGLPAGYELLPYHRFGESKYHKLGLPYQMHGVEPPGDARMKQLKKAATFNCKGKQT